MSPIIDPDVEFTLQTEASPVIKAPIADLVPPY